MSPLVYLVYAAAVGNAGTFCIIVTGEIVKQ